MDSSLGGVNDSLYILKYNGMRYERPIQFATSLSQDLEYLIDSEWRRHSKPIRMLKLATASAEASKAKILLKTPECGEMLEDDRTTQESPPVMAVGTEITDMIVKQI